MPPMNSTSLNHSLTNNDEMILNCAFVNVTEEPPREKVQMEAFFYIVVVIVFYASSIVLLMIKYARRDDEEKSLSYQYSEFVKRDKFQDPRYKNSLALLKTKEVLQAVRNNNPIIMVTSCSDLSGSTPEIITFACNNSGLLQHVGHLSTADVDQSRDCVCDDQINCTCGCRDSEIK